VVERHVCRQPGQVHLDAREREHFIASSEREGVTGNGEELVSVLAQNLADHSQLAFARAVPANRRFAVSFA
jgi:hypothetical protein